MHDESIDCGSKEPNHIKVGVPSARWLSARFRIAINKQTHWYSMRSFVRSLRSSASLGIPRRSMVRCSSVWNSDVAVSDWVQYYTMVTAVCGWRVCYEHGNSICPRLRRSGRRARDAAPSGKICAGNTRLARSGLDKFADG